jgi:hypothetical protein
MAVLIRMPHAGAEQRRNAARMIELLESIDRRLADRRES